MKNILFLAASAAALSLTSCSQEKTTETTINNETTMPADGAAMAGGDMDAMYQARAQRIADKFYQDMKITDEATKEKVRTAYYNRAKRLAEAKAKYTADTTGMAAAMREANMATDTEFKTILTDPTQYQAYESSRSTYDESNYMDDASSSMTPAEGTGTATDGSMSSGSDMSGSAAAGTTNMEGMEKGKAKMADGSKMKMKSDGDVKMKDADGNKTKVAGDDGTMKMKGDGEKTKMK